MTFRFMVRPILEKRFLITAAGLLTLGSVALEAQEKTSDLLANKIRFKVDVREENANGQRKLDADVYGALDEALVPLKNDESPLFDGRPRTVYDEILIVVTRYEGSDCARICKILSDGTRYCYKSPPGCS